MGNTKQVQLFAAIVLSIGLTGCAQGNCRSQTSAPRSTAEAASGATTRVKVKVFKYDGSLQCGEGASVTLLQMQKDLKSIQVFSSENKADGLMHISQCGTPTGRANVYEIERENLERAKLNGFKEWLWE
jgi:hypothetical protein